MPFLWPKTIRDEQFIRSLRIGGVEALDQRLLSRVDLRWLTFEMQSARDFARGCSSSAGVSHRESRVNAIRRKNEVPLVLTELFIKIDSELIVIAGIDANLLGRQCIGRARRATDHECQEKNENDRDQNLK